MSASARVKGRVALLSAKVEFHVDAGSRQGFASDRHVLEAAEHLVGHQRDPLDATHTRVIAELAQRAGPEGDGGDIDREGGIAALARRVIMTAAHGGYLIGGWRGYKAEGPGVSSGFENLTRHRSDCDLWVGFSFQIEVFP